VARAIGSFCSLLLLWLSALGAGPAPQPVHARESARSAVELAVRDVAEAPRLAARASATHVASLRLAERNAPAPLSALPEQPVVRVARVALKARATLERQASAHAARPRWRAYDAAAPPARTRFAR
jgi:hypothetical protein